jgi:phosphatidylserine synthase
MTVRTATAVLLTAWLFVVAEAVNGSAPVWAWAVAVAAFAAACLAVRRLPRDDMVPASARQRSVVFAAGAIALIALVPLALAASGAASLAGGLIAAGIVAAAGEYNLWRVTRPVLADAQLVE